MSTPDLAEPLGSEQVSGGDPVPSVAARIALPITRIEIALCSAIVLFGASLRITGLSSGDLWEDDAWITLPVRLGLHQALRMDVSTPLFLVVLRQWAIFNPGSTTFIQLLPLAASIASIAALWWLVRTLGGRLWTRIIVTLLGAITPGAVLYSVRVKEYSVETLLGLLLLIALVKAIHHATPRNSMALLALSVIACLTSGVLVLFVIGVLAAYVVQGARERERRDRWWNATVVGMCVTAGGTYLAFYHHIPSALQKFWAAFEFSSSNTRPWNHIIAIMGEGIAHGLVGTPLLVGRFPDAYSAITKAQYDHASEIALVVFAVGLAVMARVLWEARAGATASNAAGVASVLVLVMAFGAAATGHAPLGGGRTDMWWYPAAWCLSAIVLEDLLEAAAPRLRAISGASKKALFASSVAVAIAMAVPFGIHFRAWYPHQNLRALITNNRSQILPSDWVYVAHTITFAWAFYELGPFHIVFDSSSVHTEQGWSVSVDKFNVQHVLTNDPAAVCRRTKRIWWIGSNPYASNPNNYRIVGPLLQQVDQVSPPFSSLLGLGWHRTGVVVGDGVNAQLFKHPGACT